MVWAKRWHVVQALVQTAVSGMRRGLLANNVEIELAGGKLQIKWKEGDVVWMTGPDCNRL